MNASLRTPLFFLGIVFIIGCVLRIYPSALYQQVGFDEKLYCGYVEELNEKGLFAFPEIVTGYIKKQTALPSAILPPTRFTYILASSILSQTTGSNSHHALWTVSCIFSILSMVLATGFAWRMAGVIVACLTGSFMAVAPLEIHMAQHGLIDGFFAFWALVALWLLWENLHQPGRISWLAAYAISIAVLVLTKENAFFVYLSLWLLMLVSWQTQLGSVNRALILSTLIGALLGAGVLVLLAGGLDPLFEVYLLLTRKAYALPFAILYCDGPWQRFLVDLLLVSPVITLLAVGAAFNRKTISQPVLFFMVFVGGTYLLITSVKYGINLRYTVMWDMPMRFLAASVLVNLQQEWTIKNRWLHLAVFGICFLELRQYYILFVEHNLYEPVSAYLLEILKFIKK